MNHLVNICLLLMKPPANFGKTGLSAKTQTWWPLCVLRTFPPCFLVVHPPLCLPPVSIGGQDGDEVQPSRPAVPEGGLGGVPAKWLPPQEPDPFLWSSW